MSVTILNMSNTNEIHTMDVFGRLFAFLLEESLGTEHQNRFDILSVVVIVHLLDNQMVQDQFLLAIVHDAFWSNHLL